MVLEKTLASPLDCKEIQPVHPKGDQSWVFIGRTDAEAETPILWLPHVKSWLIGKVPDAGRDWGQEEKGTTEDEVAGWHHQLDGPEFGWTLGVGDGQGGLACCNSWGHKESDMTERLIWSAHNQVFTFTPFPRKSPWFYISGQNLQGKYFYHLAWDYLWRKEMQIIFPSGPELWVLLLGKIGSIKVTAPS